MNGKAVKGFLSVPVPRDRKRRCGATNGNLACYEEAENTYVAVVAADAQAGALLSLRDARMVEEGTGAAVFVNLYALSSDVCSRDASLAKAVQVMPPAVMLLLRIPVLFSTHKDRVGTTALHKDLPFIEKVLFAGKKCLVVMNDLGDLVFVPTRLSLSLEGEEASSSSNSGDSYGEEENDVSEPFASACLFERVLDFDSSFTRPAIVDMDEMAVVCAVQSHGLSMALLMSARGEPEAQIELFNNLAVSGSFNLVSCEWLRQEANKNSVSALIVASSVDGSVTLHLVDVSVMKGDNKSKPFVVQEKQVTLVRELLQGPQTACMSIASMYCEERQEIVFVALSAEQKPVDGENTSGAAQCALKGKDGRALCVANVREKDGKETADKTSFSAFAQSHTSVGPTIPSVLTHLDRPSFVSPWSTPFLLILTVPCKQLSKDAKPAAVLRNTSTFAVRRFEEKEENHLKDILFKTANPVMGTALLYEPSEDLYTLSLFSSSTALTYSLRVSGSQDARRPVKRVFEALERTYVLGMWNMSGSPHDDEQYHRCLFCRGVYVPDVSVAADGNTAQGANAVVGQLEIVEVRNMAVYTADAPSEETTATVSSAIAANVNDELKECLRSLLQEEIARMEARLNGRLDTLESKLNLLIASKRVHDH